MSNKYEEEIFKFLTREENFSMACEIFENFPKVRDKLIGKLWGEVKKKLEEKAKEKEGTWKKNWTIYKNEVNRTYSKMGFWFEPHGIGVVFENLSGSGGNILYGIWIDNNRYKKRKEEISQYPKFKKIRDNRGMKFNQWWLALKHLDYNFQTRQTLEQILPHKNDDLSNEFANLLFEFAEEVVPEIELLETELLTIEKTTT